MKILRVFVQIEGDEVRLCAETDRLVDSVLWFSVPCEHENALVTDVCDGFLVALIPWLLQSGGSISSEVPATRVVLQNLESLVSLLVHENPREYKYVKIDVPIVEELHLPQGERGALVSGSCGVDAIHTLMAAQTAKYCKKPSHIVFNNTGSSLAGEDPVGLLHGRLKRSRRFALENNLGFIYVDSNYSDFVGGLHYSLTHLYVNMAVGYLLAKKFSAYHLSSGVDFKHVSYGGDPAHAESVLIALLSSNYFHVSHIAGDFKSRYEKIKDLLSYPPAADFLNVCFVKPENCGLCEKCRRTLMALECLNAVERFSSVFDVQKYHRNRDRVFAQLINDYLDGNEFVTEMWGDFRKLLHMRHWLDAFWARATQMVGRNPAVRWLNVHIRHRQIMR